MPLSYNAFPRGVPVGGDSPVKVQARMIAASNSNLEKLCGEGQFRRSGLRKFSASIAGRFTGWPNDSK
jgi:transcriptional regulator of aromatic amino acid metabolism